MICVYSKGGQAPYPMAGLIVDEKVHQRMLYKKPYAPKNKKWRPKKDPNEIQTLRKLRTTIVQLKTVEKMSYQRIADRFGFTPEQIRHQYRIAQRGS